MSGTEDRKPRQWQKWLLAISLTLNFLVIGAVVGAGIGHRLHDARGELREVAFGPYTKLLEPSDRDELRRAFLAAAPRLGEMRRIGREDFSELAAALRADPFDPDAVKTIIMRQTGRASERLQTGAGLLIDRLVSMPAESRLALADRIDSDTRYRDHD
ncbi:MAG: periplasmic heavy metal sensor [Rhodobacteraceae bacterium]|nr:periplasmic heavy metal sensor [Paracoccaceae bacterium]